MEAENNFQTQTKTHKSGHQQYNLLMFVSSQERREGWAATIISFARKRTREKLHVEPDQGAINAGGVPNEMH